MGVPAAAKQPEAAPPAAENTTPAMEVVAVTAEAKEQASPAKVIVTANSPTKTSKKKTEVAPAVRLAPLTEVSAPIATKPACQFKVVTRGEHAEICKLVVDALPTSVLEIGVGDGLRADAVMQSLLAVSSDKSVRYAAIDQFEMVGGPIKLKDFHLRMRAIDVRPQVFPDPVIQGLRRFSSTLGFADVVIASIPDEQWNSNDTQSLIARITRPSSVVLHLSQGRWKRSIVNKPEGSRARQGSVRDC